MNHYIIYRIYINKINVKEKIINRINYYNTENNIINKREKVRFKRILICFDIIKKCGFDEIFDLSDIKIDKLHLINYILENKKEINLLFDIKINKLDKKYEFNEILEIK